jgi:hypothetical protein
MGQTAQSPCLEVAMCSSPDYRLEEAVDDGANPVPVSLADRPVETIVPSPCPPAFLKPKIGTSAVVKSYQEPPD